MRTTIGSAAGLLFVVAFASLTLAAPPASVPGRGKGLSVAKSRVQRALESREQVLERARIRVTQRASTRLVERRNKGRLRPQQGTGRLGEKKLLKVGQDEHRGLLRRARGLFTRTRSRETGKVADSKPGKVATNIPQRRGRSQPIITARADRLLQKRLASIDQMRDLALENGNLKLLERADELETIARWQFDRRIRKTGQMGAAQIPEGADRDRPGKVFGRETAERARLGRREFGRATAETAREGGRESGDSITSSLTGRTRRNVTEESESRDSELP